VAISASRHNIGSDRFAECSGGSTLCARDTADMRKLIFIGIVAVGAIVGLLSAIRSR
jgi:hypothetical protein